MDTLQLRTLSGSSTTVDAAELEAFRAHLQGELLTPDQPAYEDARKIWYAMIERRPAAIVRCRTVDDIAHGVNFARSHNLLISVRGGGHNIAGNALCEQGLMIDLSQMKAVQVDPETQTAKVGPGATLADFDREAQKYGLATPLGINSTTGVAGLTLGGGFGWLTRKYGVTVDNLIGADVITANGQRVHASEQENADLFWGIRGGWRQLWHRHQLRVSLASGRPGNHGGSGGVSLRPGQACALSVPGVGRQPVRRYHGLGRVAACSAPAFPTC